MTALIAGGAASTVTGTLVPSSDPAYGTNRAASSYLRTGCGNEKVTIRPTGRRTSGLAGSSGSVAVSLKSWVSAVSVISTVRECTYTVSTRDPTTNVKVRVFPSADSTEETRR